MEYNIKDIVYVENYVYKNGAKGTNHNFIIIDKEKAIDIDYYGLLMSSNTNKVGDNFPYNVLLKRDKINNLRKDSIIKCDDYITIDKNEIKFKIGEISDNDLKIFKEKFNKYLEEKNRLNAEGKNPEEIKISKIIQQPQEVKKNEKRIK